MKETTLNSIREINFNGIKIGGENSFPIFNPLYVLEIPVFNINSLCTIAKEYYNSVNLKDIIKKAQASECDILGLKFNIESIEQVDKAVNIMVNLFPDITKPLMLSGAGNDEIDRVLLPILINKLDRMVIINNANENTYKDIIPSVIKGNHIVVLKSPIDINLAKELNILSADLGLSLDNILVDTDIGALGYGLEYGYSIMEKVKLEGLKGDKYLNMPLISFGCNESLKTKEAKSDEYGSSWGLLSDRARFFELTTASALKACGANIIVMNYPPNISVMKGLVG